MARKRPVDPEPDYNCVTCGACCCNPDQNRAIEYREYIEVGKRDAIRKNAELMKKLTFVNDKGEIHMRLVGVNQRCCALEGRIGRAVSCSIYELRPAVCRRVKPGDEWCVKVRVERGIDPPPPKSERKPQRTRKRQSPRAS
jgi:Fe-S-cluster containining protein